VRHAVGPAIRYGAVPGVQGIETLHARRLTAGFERHFHDTYAFGIVLDGVERCLHGRTLHFYEAGTVPLFNPGEAHDGGPALQKGWSYRMVYVDQDAVAALFPGQPVFPGPARRDVDARRRIGELFEAIDSGTALGIDQALRGALGCLLALREREGDDAPPAGLERVRERLESEFCGSLRLSDLCADAGVSQARLLRAFARAYGLTPHRYQQALRIAKARRMILGGAPLVEVAAACGYADQSHLNRWFLRICRVTPGAYRGNFVQDD
jgi:AraC-like DNA-binding protein